ncbi:hypothetical protein HDU97_010354 [Phlyctochytrium planicorne]|nr:hypothetical protein HDU97_010354 [Phlyctochytrium planicorne]
MPPKDAKGSSKSQTPSSASKAPPGSGAASDATQAKPKSRKESAQSKEKKGASALKDAASSQGDSRRNGATVDSAGSAPDAGGALDGKDQQGKGGATDGPESTQQEQKPKIDPEKIKFLKDPVPVEIFSRIDAILGKAAKSLPNLAVSWRRNESPTKKSEEGDGPPTEVTALTPSTLFSGTDPKDKTPSVMLSILDIKNERPHGIPKTAVEIFRQRNNSVSKVFEDPEFSKRGISDQTLIKALKLRERRLKRRRDRAAGVPPDPNDSDDSLLAELKETTDSAIFPGVEFDDDLNLDDPADASQFSTTLQFRDPRMLDTSKGRVLNPSRRSEMKPDLLDDPKSAESEHKDFIRSLSPNSLDKYEKMIIKKHYKHGILTMFKGKDEMKVSHAKVVAKKEIDTVRRAVKEKEKDLIRLEEELSMCRTQLSKGISEAGRLAREIKQMADTEKRFKVSGLLVGKRQTDRIMSTPDDPLDFELPDVPHLNQNRSYRALRDEYLTNKELVIKSLQAIPLLEQAIIPTEHDLAALQLQENKLRELDQKLQEADIKEDFEYQVVEKYKKMDVQRKADRKRKKEEKERRDRELEEERARIEKQEYEKVLETKREKLRERYESTKAMRQAQSQFEADAKEREAQRKEKAVHDLFERISKIRRHIERTRKSRGDANSDEDDPLSLRLVEGEQDLSESHALRQTRIELSKRKVKAHSQSKQRTMQQDLRKIEIMKKLLREEIIQSRAEYFEKQEKELHKALASLTPTNEDRAFPAVHSSEILEKALQKRKQEMISRINRVRELENQRIESVLGGLADEKEDQKSEAAIEAKAKDSGLIVTLVDHFPPKTPGREAEADDKSEELQLSSTKVTRRFLPPPRMKIKPQYPGGGSLLLPLTSALPFTAEPATVMFADYDAEKVYRKKVVLTNTSCQVNTFRLLPVPVDIASYFEVLAKPPGRMSAGMVCEVEFIFRPPPGYDQDVTDGQITFLAEHGGQFTIKIGCSTRKCQPWIASVGGTGIITQKLDPTAADDQKDSLLSKLQSSNRSKGASLHLVRWDDNSAENYDCLTSEPKETAIVEGKNKITVDFGTCVLGDTVSRILEISNEGALQTDFEVLEIDATKAKEILNDIRMNGHADKNSGRETLFGLLASKYLKSEPSLEKLDAKSDDGPPKENTMTALSDSAQSPDSAEISPTIVDVSDPTEEADLSTRNFSVVKNEKGTLKGYTSVPVYLEFSPPYVEPKALIDSEDSEAGKRPPDRITNKVFYMISFKLPNVSPLIIECRARHLESPLLLDTSEIDFGTCVVGSTYKLPLVIRNRSNIALKFWLEDMGVHRKMTSEAIGSAQGTSLGGADIIGSCIASDGIDSEDMLFGSRDGLSEERLESSFFGSGSTEGDEPIAANNRPVNGVNPMLANFAHMESGRLAAMQVLPLEFRNSDSAKRRIAKKKPQKSKRSDSLTLQIPQVGEVEVSPRLAFIQPFEPFTVWCKVRPSRAASLMQDNEMFKVPLVVKFNNHGIESPLSVELRGSITTSDLTFILPNGATSELSFGTASVYLTREIPIRIWNHSTLPQVAKFLGSHHGLSVVSSKKNVTESGLTVIPPMSQITKRVRFEPKDVGQYKLRLVCHSIWDRKFEIVCTGLAVKPPLRFNASFIRFRATSMGSVADARVKLQREHLDKSHSLVPTHKAKEAWREEAAINFDDLYEEGYDVVGFEFGEPLLVGVATRNGGHLTSSQLAAIQKDISEGLKLEEQEAEEAVLKANKASTKQIKLITGSAANTLWEDAFNPVEFAQLFKRESTSVESRRIILPKQVIKKNWKAASEQLPPIMGPHDMPPIGVSPMKGTVQPGKSVSVEVTLCPPPITAVAAMRGINLDDKDSDGGSNVDDPSSPSKIRPPSAMKNATAGPPRSRQGTAGADRRDGHNANLPKVDVMTIAKLYKGVDDTCLTYLVPCSVKRVFRQHQPETERPNTVSTDPKPRSSVPSTPYTASSFGDESTTVYIEVVAPIVRPDILLLDPETGVLDFDKVPVGKTIVQKFTILNITKSTLNLKHEGFDPAGPFSLAKPLTDLEPDGTEVVEIAFQPMGSATFVAEFVVFTPTTQVRCKLQGQGTVPSLQIDPTDRQVFLGDVAIGDSATKPFKIINTGSYPLICTLSLSTVHPLQPYPRSHGTVNFSRQNAFSLSATTMTIPPGSRQEVVVKFLPDRESDLFFDFIVLDVWGLPTPQKIKVHGRCWDTSTALLGYDAPPESKEEEASSLPPKFEFEFAQRLLSNNFQPEITYYDLFPNEKPPPGEGNGSSGGSASPARVGSADPNNAGGGNVAGAAATSTTNAATSVAASNGAAAGKKSKGKEVGKDASSSGNVSEDVVADLLRLTTRETVRFVTILCPWRKNEQNGTWWVETKEIQLASLKPSTFTKPDTKRPSVAEFSIEPWHASFEYINAFNEFAIVPPNSLGLEDTMARFSFGDVTKGTLELGTVKSIKIQIHNPVKEFWTAIKAYEDMFNLRLTPEVLPTAPLTKDEKRQQQQSQEDPKKVSGGKSIAIAPAPRINTIHAPEQTPHPPSTLTPHPPSHSRVPSTQKPQTDSKKPALSPIPIIASPSQPSPTTTTRDEASPTSLTPAHSTTGRRPSITRSSFSLAQGPTDPMNEFKQPTRIETCFKVSFTGGYRYVDPKGVPGPTEEPRVWIVKVLADVPQAFRRPSD